MTDLSPEARRILAQAKAGQPRASHVLRARVKANLAQRLAAEAAGAAPSGAAGLPAWLLPGASALILVAGIAAVSVWASRGAEVPLAAAPAVERAADRAANVQGPSAGPSRADESARTGEHADPAAAAPVGADDAAPPTAQAVPAPPRAEGAATRRAGSNSDDLRAELQLLSSAEAALREHDPRAALRVLTQHAQQFRSGQLRQERAGLRLIAQCTLGRDPKAALSQYLSGKDDSVLHARVSEACEPFLR